MIRRYTWRNPRWQRVLAWAVGRALGLECPVIHRLNSLREAWTGEVFYDDPWGDP